MIAHSGYMHYRLPLLENGVELYWDRPKESWPRGPNGELAMFTAPLDVDDLLRQT